METQPPISNEFHLFKNLPPEIRYKIYSFSLPGPRLIPLTYIPPQTPQQFHTSTNLSTDQPPRPIYGIKTPIKPPALLHTTHESRIHAQEHYTPYFSLHGSQHSPTIYIDPKSDIAYFPSIKGYLASFQNFTNVHTLSDPEALRGIERLAVHEDLFLEQEKWRWRGVEVEKGVDLREEMGLDGITGQCLNEFWDVVGRKFCGLREVWILGDEMEIRMLREEAGFWREDVGTSVRGSLSARQSTARFEVQVRRAVDEVAMVAGRVVPRWRALGKAGAMNEGGDITTHWARQ